LLTVLFSVDSFAQIKPVQQPKFETATPTNTGYYFNSNFNNSTPQTNTSTYSPPMGGNADDIIKQQNYQAMKMMGYEPPVVPPSDPYLAHQFIINQYNQSVNPTQSQKQEKELTNILNEANKEEYGKRSKFEYYKSSEFSQKTKPYWDALNSLKSMASSGKSISLKDAFYKMESAYGIPYLTHKEYSDIIKENADFIKNMMIQNGLDPKNNEAMHKMIQKFYKDTVTITIKNPDMPKPIVKTHYPYSYDYIDYKGEKDHRNYFVTKAFATGAGQCNGLPIVYALTAEALGAKVYLSLAPNHSFNKYPDNAGKIHNYEPTSHWNISDDWYSEHMFITPEAEKSGIYLDTLNKIMILGDCIAQLGYGYLTKYGVADGAFLNECINASIGCFPKNNNLMALLLKSSTLAHMLDRLLYENGIKDLKDIDKAKGARELYEALKQNEAYLKYLGYAETPDGMYEEQMQLQEFRGKVQEAKGFSGKEKRNMFTTIK
jgi:hypothetical protein